MQKRVFIIHGWDGSPENCWFPWLKKQLEAEGFSVFALAMPNPEEPEIKSWVNKLNESVENPDENTYFVGHSIGCQTILRYLEQLPAEVRIGGIVCVAGFFRLPHIVEEDEESQRIAKPWLETKIDCGKIKQHTDNIIAIFSDNDPDVDLKSKDEFEEALGAKTFIEHNKGHFSDDAGVKELLIVLSSILEISN